MNDGEQREPVQELSICLTAQRMRVSIQVHSQVLGGTFLSAQEGNKRSDMAHIIGHR